VLPSTCTGTSRKPTRCRLGVKSPRLSLDLTIDGIHPSFADNYLNALAIYRYLSDHASVTTTCCLERTQATDAKAIARQAARGISSKLRLRAALSP
jgi:hypothetical protein